MSKAHRVLFVLDTFGRGGAERAVLELAIALEKRGHNCRVAALGPPYTLAREAEIRGIKVERLNLSTRWSVIEAVWKLARVVRRFDPDIIHAGLFFSSLYSGLVPSFAKRVRVVTFYNLGYDAFPSVSITQKLRKRLDQVVSSRLIDEHIAVSDAVADHARRHLYLSNVPTIPNGVDLERLQFHGKQEIANPPLVVVPATLKPEKGHYFLLHAVAHLKETGLEVRLALAGDGPLRRDLEELSLTLNISDLVEFRGDVEHDEMIALLQQADLVVLASTHEGAPVAVLEALAVGVPVVATAVGGLTNLLRNKAGILVPPSDPTSLASAMRLGICDLNLRSTLRINGFERVSREADINTLAEIHDQLYAEARFRLLTRP